MINATQKAAEILLNPENAGPLFDLMIWANQPQLEENDDYDDVLDMCWQKLDLCRLARAEYARKRLAPESVTLNASDPLLQ